MGRSTNLLGNLSSRITRLRWLHNISRTMTSPSTNLEEYQRRVHGATVWCAAERDEWHPALHAAATDSVNVLKVLRLHGADLGMHGPRNLTAVYVAAVSGSLRTLQYLIEAKVDLDVEYDGGFGSALEFLGAPYEADGVYGSRLHGTPLEAAKMVRPRDPRSMLHLVIPTQRPTVHHARPASPSSSSQGATSTLESSCTVRVVRC